MLLDYFLLFLTALLWGVTNVLIKRTSKGIKELKEESSGVRKILGELKYLIGNWKVNFIDLTSV
jgi:Putative transmembrane family 234